MSDQIAEIRARHETDDRWRLTTSMICPGAHDDRATLLAEVERMTRQRDKARVEVARLRTGLRRVSLASQSSMSSKEECGRIARETLEVKS